MRIRIRRIFSGVLIVVHILLIFASVFMMTHTSYVLSSESCESWFGCTPQEFLDPASERDDCMTDFSPFAYVDRTGNLSLWLTKKQEQAFGGFLKQSIENSVRNFNVDVSFDNLTVTVYRNFETLSEDLNMGLECVLGLQLYCTINPTDQDICFIQKDWATGEMLYTLLFKSTDDDEAVWNFILESEHQQYEKEVNIAISQYYSDYMLLHDFDVYKGDLLASTYILIQLEDPSRGEIVLLRYGITENNGEFMPDCRTVQEGLKANVLYTDEHGFYDFCLRFALTNDRVTVPANSYACETVIINGVKHWFYVDYIEVIPKS